MAWGTCKQDVTLQGQASPRQPFSCCPQPPPRGRHAQRAHRCAEKLAGNVAPAGSPASFPATAP
eukprot:14096333-Alexandrium_andersonii.AAC.1